MRFRREGRCLLALAVVWTLACRERSPGNVPVVPVAESRDGPLSPVTGETARRLAGEGVDPCHRYLECPAANATAEQIYDFCERAPLPCVVTTSRQSCQIVYSCSDRRFAENGRMHPGIADVHCPRDTGTGPDASTVDITPDRRRSRRGTNSERAVH